MYIHVLYTPNVFSNIINHHLIHLVPFFLLSYGGLLSLVSFRSHHTHAGSSPSLHHPQWSNMKLRKVKASLSIPKFNFRFLTLFMITIYCHQDHRSAFSIYLVATQNAHIKFQTNSRRSRFPPSEAQLQNTMFTKRLICTCLLTNSLVVLLILMLSGDVHPNPGPLSTSRTSSISSVTSCVDSDIDLKHYFSFVHYNVQSLYTSRAGYPLY